MHVEGDGYEQLNNAIQGGSFTYSPRTTKAEIIDYYRETYKGRGTEGWKQHIVKDLAAQTGIKSKNLERRFDPSRINNPEKRNVSQYKALGEKLPLKKEPKDLTGKRARITSVIWLTVSNDPPRRKELDAKNTKLLSAKATNELKRGSFNPMIAAYGINPGDVESLEVESISVDFV